MKFLMPCCIFIAGIIFQNITSAQSYVIKDIKFFGARGDGKTNDHQAFQKAATYFNNRGGNGKLIISKGIYIVGKQNFNRNKGNLVYEGEDVLHFTNVKNLRISGVNNAILRYTDTLKFGSFSKVTGKRSEHSINLHDTTDYPAYDGSCILFDKCYNASVTNLIIDGNNNKIILGGSWSDVGTQLPHYGIFILNSRNITVDKVNAHHFCLDGISVSNKDSLQKDSIEILNSSFEFNARQGLSWIGGNDLIVKNCKFNNTGKGAFSSAPSAGVDIEAEVGPIRNGYFTNCEFVNNTGVGMVAGTGDDSDCTFTNCTFWGATNWSIWVTKPGFTFKGCNIYGAIVHGYNSPDDKNATKFIGCTFEDKPYQGKEPYGNLLIESNNAKRMSFTDCKFIANKKRLCWISIDPKTKPEEKYQFQNCSFVIKNSSNSEGDVIGLIKGMALKNCTFDFRNPIDKKRGINFINYKDGVNVDLGGNKIIYSED